MNTIAAGRAFHGGLGGNTPKSQKIPVTRGNDGNKGIVTAEKGLFSRLKLLAVTMVTTPSKVEVIEIEIPPKEVWRGGWSFLVTRWPQAPCFTGVLVGTMGCYPSFLPTPACCTPWKRVSACLGGVS